MPLVSNPKFKVGDQVMIVRKVEVEQEWENSWASLMTTHVGTNRVLVIYKISGTGIRFKDLNYGWPEGALDYAKGQLCLF